MCEGEEEPLCVKWCTVDALTVEEREVELEEEVKMEDVEIGLASMVDKYGLQKVMDTVARMTKKD
jgi:benzoyl-CoA reductase subunit BamC